MAKWNDATSGQTEAVINRMGGFENWLLYAGGAGRIVFDLLTHLRDWTATAQPALVTTQEFWELAGVKTMGDNFKTHCLGVDVKTVGDTTLTIHKLERRSLDAPILAERGEKVRIPLSQIGPFLNAHRGSSEWFILYPEELPLWVVDARWHAEHGGWNIAANSVENPNGWDAGHRVVSRK
ncbi:MAG: hypothetical protein Q8O46_03090 [bacterium]|nr:hypothetical protein [bacterium]